VKDHAISQEEFELFRCWDCDFLFTQNIPAPQAIGKYYQSEDYISHSDTREGLVNKLYHQARQFMLAQKYKLIRKCDGGQELLDVGCGTGYFLDYMIQKGYDGIGVEVDEGAREFGQKQFGLSIHPPAALKDGRIRGPFSVITLWHVLEHLHDLHEQMDIYHRLLEEEGTLLIAVPNHKCFDSRKYGSWWAGYDVPRHLWHFSPRTLKRLAEQHGFFISGKKLMPLDPFYNSMLSEKYQGKSLGLVRGGFTGLNALMQGQTQIDKASSIIYLLRKA
jgi:2-polyprenyl-3-methyl-5-hydroxy-6-metoxy-1,4-benzoquinol methylase